MPLEPTFNFIDDMDSTNPNNSPDQVKEAANHLRGVKQAVQGSFPNLGQVAVTKTAAELNTVVLPDSSDTLTNKTIADATFTGTQTGFTGDVTGNVTGSAFSVTGTGVISSVHLGTNSVNADEISPGAVGTSEIATNAVTGAELANNVVTSGHLQASSVDFDSEIVGKNISGAWATSGTITVPRGIYAVYFTGTDPSFEALISGTWRRLINSAFVISNGSNVRFNGNFSANSRADYVRVF